MASPFQKSFNWLAQSNRFHQRRFKKFYRELIEPNQLCYDIGAGLGKRTEAWLSLGAQVVSIEPQSDRMVNIEKRLEGNNNVFTVRKALSNKKDMTIMKVNTAPLGVGTLTTGNMRDAISRDDVFSDQWDREEPVELTTLDEVIKTHGIPDFCQINAKGYELDILQGLTQSVKYLAFGYLIHEPQYALNCIDYLSTLGDYEYKWTYKNEHEFATKRWITPTAICTVIRGFKGHERSGDIYARLRGEFEMTQT